MTKKQQELQRSLPFLVGKEVQVWTTGQFRFHKPFTPDPQFEGTVDRFTGIYLVLKNVILASGKFYAEYDVNAGIIAAIKEKKK